jgi:long-chain acyl-CoA synthetase
MTWSVAGVVRKWANEAEGAPALSFLDRAWTWGGLYEDSCRVANALASEGVSVQDRVAVLDKNTPACVQILVGASLLGAVPVSVNWRLAPPEIAQIVNDAEARVLVVGSEFLPQLAAVEDQLLSVRRIVVAGGGHPKHEAFDAWTAAQPDTDPGTASSLDQVALQLYTSGTTGLPKGVMLTNANLEAGVAAGLAGQLGVDTASVSMVAMPLFHIGGTGWMLAGMSMGAHTVLIPEIDPAGLLASIEQHRITHAFLVPAVLMFLLAVPTISETDFSSLRCMLYGASPISEDVLTRCLDVMGCDFVQVYGATETTGAITLLAAEEHRRRGADATRLRSCGRPLPHVTIRIANPDDGSEQPVAEVGELWTRSGQNMAGYWGKPDDTARTIDADGWLHTGDAAYRDADGFLYLHDRIKDMIVSGGENIYPAEIENALMSHPAVADVAVIGVPHEKWGETVKAIVVLAPDTSAGPDELIAHCRERLARFKCPTSVDFVDVLPRNPSGKILKRELREPYWAGRERRIN